MIFQVTVITISIDMQPSCNNVHVEIPCVNPLYSLVDGISKSTITGDKPRGIARGGQGGLETLQSEATPLLSTQKKRNSSRFYVKPFWVWLSPPVALLRPQSLRQFEKSYYAPGQTNYCVKPLLYSRFYFDRLYILNIYFRYTTL